MVIFYFQKFAKTRYNAINVYERLSTDQDTSVFPAPKGQEFRQCIKV